MAVVTGVRTMVSELLQLYCSTTGAALVVEQKAQQDCPKVMEGVVPSAPTQFDFTLDVNSEGKLQATATAVASTPVIWPLAWHCSAVVILALKEWPLAFCMHVCPVVTPVQLSVKP